MEFEKAEIKIFNYCRSIEVLRALIILFVDFFVRLDKISVSRLSILWLLFSKKSSFKLHR